MYHIDGRVGQQVLFGRRNGEETLGVIVKINPRKFKVKQLESRGVFRTHPIGTIWTVPASLCKLIDGAPLMPLEAPQRRRNRVPVPPLPLLQPLAALPPLMSREEAKAIIDLMPLARITELLTPFRSLVHSEADFEERVARGHRAMARNEQ